VDDDDDVREILSNYFKKHKYSAVEAADGEVAVQVFNYQKIDIIITDVRMPKMGGMNLLRYIRSMNQDLPVIMMTGFELSKNDIACLSYKANAYVSKPFSLEYMRYLVETLLK